MNVLVLCTGNSCRSQIAEGFFRKYLPESIKVFSAGLEKHGLNPKAVEMMGEVGIDISHHTSNTIDELPVKDFNYVVTVCDNAFENCPYYPAKTEIIHQSFTDPTKMGGNAQAKDASYRICRDAIGMFCKEVSQKIISEQSLN